MGATPQSIPALREAEQPSAEAEIAVLQARIEVLEAELTETHRRANAAIAAAQERVYWLDRWHVDLNELMLRREAVAARAMLRVVRAMLRAVRRFTRAIK